MPGVIKIVLVSDNHGLRHPLEYLRTKYTDADYFLHCGDAELPVYEMAGFAVVQGNNDPYGSYPQRRILEIGEHRILMVHGHRDMIFGQFGMLAEKARTFGCDIVCFGHTHIPFDKTIKGIRVLNPGSIWRNRDGSKPSYMILTLDGPDVYVEKCIYQVK